MSSPNPFSDDFTRREPRRSNDAGVVILVLAIVGGVLLLMCGGMFAAGVWMAQQAQRDFEEFYNEMELESIEESPFMSDPDSRRYYELRNTGRYEEALAELETALAKYPDDAMLHNEKAWMLATCPVEEIRNGELAVEHGLKACDLTDWSSPAYVDTLAAAHAEAGDFAAAVECQQQAIELDEFEWYQPQMNERLELYKSNKRYRQGVASPTVPPTFEGTDGEEVENADIGGSI